MYSTWLNNILRDPENLKPLKINGNNYESEGKVFNVRNEILSIVYPAGMSGDDAKYKRMKYMMALPT
jgi:hypothetical protein